MSEKLRLSHADRTRVASLTASVYRFVTLLSFLLGTVTVAEAQEPGGYWLYVEGAWKGGFARRAECDAAGVNTGKLYECRPLYFRPETRTPREQADDRWANAVHYCLGAGQNFDRGFDAYVSGPRRVRMVGTARAQVAFEKCLTEQGQPTSPVPSPIEIK